MDCCVYFDCMASSVWQIHWVIQGCNNTVSVKDLRAINRCFPQIVMTIKLMWSQSCRFESVVCDCIHVVVKTANQKEVCNSHQFPLSAASVIMCFRHEKVSLKAGESLCHCMGRRVLGKTSWEIMSNNWLANDTHHVT